MNTNWLSRWTRLEPVWQQLFDEPVSGWQAWIRATWGVVVMLVCMQFVTGVLLAFYYVPSVESAYTTIAFVEKSLPAGSWIRALHHYGSQWLTLFLALHVGQQLWRGSYTRRPVAWIASVLLLALVFGSGATGYSLPWDACAFYNTRVAEGIAEGLPLFGNVLRRWLLGGPEISTLTLSRFFALHVLTIPALIFLVAAARLFVFREPGSAPMMSAEDESPSLPFSRSPRLRISASPRQFQLVQLSRNALSAGVVFLALALFAKKFYAPLGPPATAIPLDYLPRPGAQFLWLFALIKYLPGTIGAIASTALAALILIGLLWLPFSRRLRARPSVLQTELRHKIVFAIFAAVFVVCLVLTAAVKLQDLADSRVRIQLARQEQDEKEFRAQPFVPVRLRTDESERAGNSNQSNANAAQAGESTGPPQPFLKNCSICHGEHGEGARLGPLRFPSLVGVSDKPRRSFDDIVAILNDPTAYGLRPPMKSFKGKLTDQEMREIAAWVVTLRKNK